MKRSALFRVVGLVLLVALSAFLVTGCGKKVSGGGDDPEKVAISFVDATYTNDGATVLDLLPTKAVEYSMAQADKSRKQLTEDLNAGLQADDSTVNFLYGDGWKVVTEITSREVLDNDELKELQGKYDGQGIDLTVQEAVLLTMTLTIEATTNPGSQEMGLVIVKVDGRWYVDVFSAGIFGDSEE